LYKQMSTKQLRRIFTQVSYHLVLAMVGLAFFLPLAWMISTLRYQKSQNNYKAIGGGSPLRRITEEQAIETGRVFLDSKNYTTGNVLSVTLEEMNPHYYFYWHELFGLEKTDVGDTELSWFVKFDQAENAGHWFLVCVDAHTGEIVGGSQCR